MNEHFGSIGERQMLNWRRIKDGIPPEFCADPRDDPPRVFLWVTRESMRPDANGLAFGHFYGTPEKPRARAESYSGTGWQIDWWAPIPAGPLEHSFTRNDRNEPEWDIPCVVKVTRMDNSLAMTHNAGRITDGKKAVADVDIPLGGFAFIIKEPSEGPGLRERGNSYGVECKEMLKYIYSLSDVFAKPAAKPNFKKPPAPSIKRAVGKKSPTGRRSSEPNIQNIPIRTEEGRKIKEAFRKSRGR